MEDTQRVVMTRRCLEGPDELKAAMAQVEAETGEKPIAATYYRCEDGEILVMSLRNTYLLTRAAP